MRLLIVEDSQVLADALRHSLTREGYVCDHAGDGRAALGYLDSYPYDLVLLDLMLPRVDGFGVLEALRRRSHRAWVLVLSARDQIADRVAALDAGADDYLVKPFALDELLARLRALVRRPLDAPTPILAIGDLQVDPRTRRARWKTDDLDLTPKEYGVLELLLRMRGQVLSRAQVYERLYDSESSASDKAVEVIVSTLRAKLSQAGAGEPIRTRRGFGYVID